MNFLVIFLITVQYNVRQPFPSVSDNCHLLLPARFSTRVPVYLSRQLRRVSGVRTRQRLRSSSSTTLVISRTSRAIIGARAHTLLLRLQFGTACHKQSVLRHLWRCSESH